MAAEASERDARRERAALAAFAFAVAVPATYALERAYELVRGEPSDPRTVLRTLHTAYYWRVGVATWWGVVVAILCLALLPRRSEERSFTKLQALAGLVALGFALFVFGWP